MGNIEIFAIRLKQLRETLNMTQAEFSRYISIKQQTLSGYERGIMKPPLDIAKSIAEKCNISIDWLCGLRNERELYPNVNTYKDIALKILDLIKINVHPYTFNLGWGGIDQAPDLVSAKIYSNDFVITIPQEPELIKFFEAYKELNQLFNNGLIQQHVINTWLEGALEELASIPINCS